MVKILDSTLREGEQTNGVYFPPGIKQTIAQYLDQIGVDIIEVGNPSVDPEIAKAITQISQVGLKAKIAAHTLCRIDHVQQALDCGVDFLGLFFSVSEQRLQRDYHLPLEAAIDKITSVIAYAREQRPDLLIRYTPEDTVRSPLENVIAAAKAAVQAGADIISIADTTGYSSPFHPHRQITPLIQQLRSHLAAANLHPQIEVHFHNDRGLALPNALEAYQAGADIIDASVMGLGERAGIVDLATLLMNIQELEGRPQWQLTPIPDLYALVSEQSQIPIPAHQPIVGDNAFTHYAGVHVKAIAQDEGIYQSLEPEIFGRQSKIALGMQSGYMSLKLALQQIGRTDLIEDAYLMEQILQEIKRIAKRGSPIEIETELPIIVKCCVMEQLVKTQD